MRKKKSGVFFAGWFAGNGANNKKKLYEKGKLRKKKFMTTKASENKNREKISEHSSVTLVDDRLRLTFGHCSNLFWN